MLGRPKLLGWPQVLAFFAVFSVACYPVTTSRAKLVGRYEVDHDFGHEALTLRDDGTFEQVFVGPSGAASRNSGRWEIVPRPRLDGSGVRLRSAVVFSDPFGRRSADLKPVEWTLSVQRIWGRLTLEFNPDLPGFKRS